MSEIEQAEIQNAEQTEQQETAREQFYVPVSLQHNKVFCGDERAPIGFDEDFIHVFGGALNIPYNFMVLKEAAQPGSVTDSFTDETASLVPVVNEAAEAQFGVHSDTSAEHGDHFHADQQGGKIGCGYGELRAPISAGIAEHRADILAEAKTLRPELFQAEEDTAFGEAVITAHGRLAERQTCFQDGGRAVVLAAIEKGSPVMLVQGAHVGKDGIINLRRNTSLRSGEALAANLAAYNQDSWAVEDAFDKISHLYPYDKRHFQIATLIDTIGTMRALGVENIETRR